MPIMYFSFDFAALNQNLTIMANILDERLPSEEKDFINVAESLRDMIFREVPFDSLPAEAKESILIVLDNYPSSDYFKAHADDE